MRHPFGIHPLADTGLAQRLDRAVLEHAGAHPCLDVGAVATFQHDRLDALQVQQLRQHEAGRSGADDRHLGAHPVKRATAGRVRGLDFPVSGSG